MGVTYKTEVIAEGNHASLAIPDEVVTELKANRRAPLVVTINGHSYQSTATGVGGQCRVVFPTADRAAAKVTGGEIVTVHLELDSGYRNVELHPEFSAALAAAGLRETFDALVYSHRREHARAIAEAKADETRTRRIVAALEKIRLGHR
jgi:hypothetical protein